MITNTKLLYEKAKQFQDERLKLINEYEEKLKSLDRFQGSKGYDEERKKLDDKHEEDLQALRDEYRSGFHTVFGGMMDAIGKRSVTAPTSDQVNLLSILKMKKKVTLEELQRTAEAVKDNPLAVSIVTEIAHDHKIPMSFDHLCPEMSSQRASDIVKRLNESIEDFLLYDTTRASRLAKKYHDDLYGAVEGGLTKRRIFTSQAEFFSEIGFDDEMLKQFSDIVDA